MENKKHALLDKQYDLEFNNKTYGIITLSAGINPLNNSWMWWFSNDNGMFSGTKKEVKNLINDIIAFKDNKIISNTFNLIK